MKYAQIKKYFTDNFGSDLEALPSTLIGGYKNYLDVKGTARLYFDCIDNEIKSCSENGNDIRKSKAAKRYKDHLLVMISDLKNLDGWNQPVPERSKFNNKNE